MISLSLQPAQSIRTTWRHQHVQCSGELCLSQHVSSVSMRSKQGTSLRAIAFAALKLCLSSFKVFASQSTTTCTASTMAQAAMLHQHTLHRHTGCNLLCNATKSPSRLLVTLGRKHQPRCEPARKRRAVQALSASAESSLSDLQQELNAAVSAEDYSRAATLRDQLE